MEENRTVYRYVDRNSKHQANAIKIENEGKKPTRYSKTANGLNTTEDLDYQECLYNEDKLALSDLDTVYVAEGEKDADTLTEAGFLAVTNINGAPHWPDHAHDLFRNRCVVICEDNDEAGKTRTKMLVEKLSDYVSEIRLISFEGQQEKYDVTDWFEDGGDANEFGIMADNAPVLYPIRDKAQLYTSSELADIKIDPDFKEPKHPYLPRGLTIFGGAPKACKSLFAEVLGGELADAEFKILHIASEYDAEMAQERLVPVYGQSANVDIAIADQIDRFLDGGLQQIENYLKAKNHDVLIIDVYANFKAARNNEYEKEYRDLNPLKSLCERHKVDCLLLHHTKKRDPRGGGENKFDAIMGSTALQAVPDNIAVFDTKIIDGEWISTFSVKGRRIKGVEVEHSYKVVDNRFQPLDAIDIKLMDKHASSQQEFIEFIRAEKICSQKEICKRLEISQPRASQLEQALRKIGLTGGRGIPYKL